MPGSMGISGPSNLNSSQFRGGMSSMGRTVKPMPGGISTMPNRTTSTPKPTNMPSKMGTPRKIGNL